MSTRTEIKTKLKKLWEKIRKYWWFFLLVALLIIPYICAPKTATIYYTNIASEISFTLNIPERLSFDVRSDSTNSGRVLFELVPVNGAETELSLENTFAEEDTYSYSGQTEVASNGSFLHIKLETADESAFSCKIEIQQENAQDGALNKIHIYDIPKNVDIIFNNGDNTPFSVWEDNTSKGMIPDGEYRVRGCHSLCLYMNKPADDTDGGEKADKSLPSYMFGIEGSIERFDFLNSSRTTLEATVNGNTDFHDLGHVRISGRSPRWIEEDQLWIKISDAGTYPVEFELSGVAKGLKIGNSYYNLKDPAQWIHENWNTVLLSVLGTIFAAIISQLFTRKE